jgi:hypothetical protein
MLPIRCVIFSLTFFIVFSGLAWSDEYVLPPIIKDASPVDALSNDPVIPADQGSTALTGGDGSIDQTFEDELPFSVTDTGRPGGLTQFRGLGRSAEDTNVQALGIPLNPPQGGGFDFTTFPQFFWSEYRFTLSPSTSALDPRGVSGVLSLTPWTAAAISGSDADKTRSRWTAMIADSDLQQISVGEKYQDKVAVLAGLSSGQVNGPTVSVSARVYESDQFDVRFHLLATQVNETLYNFGSGVSPDQITARVLPVIQLNWVIEPDLILKSSIFYDNTYIRSDDVTNNLYTRDRSQQFGAENALFFKEWKLGLSGRSVRANGNDFNSPTENIANSSVERTWTFDTSSVSQFIAVPSIEGVYVTSFGLKPQAGLGLREQWNDNALALFARGNYSYRFPALEDRYYTLVGAMGNPGLTPEKDLTGIAGFEGKSGLLQGSLEGYYQIRNNVQVPVTLSDGFTVQQQNLGQAKIASLIASGSAQATSQLKLSDSLSYNHSRVNTLQSAFPYMPSVVNTFGSEWAFVRHMIFSADVRAQSSSFVSNSSPHLPAVVFADVQLAYTFQGGIQVIGRAENISDSNLVLTQGYPSKGRVLALSVVGPL